jgi:hypothetical protein
VVRDAGMTLEQEYRGEDKRTNPPVGPQRGMEEWGQPDRFEGRGKSRRFRLSPISPHQLMPKAISSQLPVPQMPIPPRPLFPRQDYLLKCACIVFSFLSACRTGFSTTYIAL